MLAHDGEFAFGLRLWLEGSHEPEAEAAGSIVAETFLMWRAFLKSKFKKGGASTVTRTG